jgi:hypothetical protein
MSGLLTIRETHPYVPCTSRAPWNSLLKAKSLKRVKTFTLEPEVGRVQPIPEMSSRHLSYCPDTRYLASFNGPHLFNNHTFLVPT